MKKLLTVLTLVLILSSCIFATQKVTVSIDPYSFQSFVQKDEQDKVSVKSKYGIGGGLGYAFILDNGISFGADIKADTYTIEGKDAFIDISFLAKAGYMFSFSDAFALYANVKGGLDLQTTEGTVSAVIEFGPEVGVSYNLTDELNIFASCEGLFGFPGNKDAKYSEYRVTPTIGAGLCF